MYVHFAHVVGYAHRIESHQMRALAACSSEIQLNSMNAYARVAVLPSREKIARASESFESTTMRVRVHQRSLHAHLTYGPSPVGAVR